MRFVCACTFSTEDPIKWVDHLDRDHAHRFIGGHRPGKMIWWAQPMPVGSMSCRAWYSRT